MALSLALLAVAASAEAAPPPTADCDAQVRADPEARASYACYYAEARQTGEYEHAIARLTTLSEEFPDNPWVWVTLGNLREDQAQPGADEALERGIELLAAEPSEDPSAEVFTRINYANALRHRGRIDAAAAQLEAAFTRATGNTELLTIVELERARFVVFTGGDQHDALATLESLRPKLFPDGRYQARVVWLNTTIIALHRLDRLDRVLALTDELQTIAAAEGDRYVEASAALNGLTAQASVILAQARPDLDDYRRRALAAVELGRAAGNIGVEVHSVCALGEIAGPDQLALARRCFALAESVDEPDIRGAALGLAVLSLHTAGAPTEEVDAALALVTKDLATAELGDQLDGALIQAALLALRDGPRAAATIAEATIEPFRRWLATTDSFITAAESSGRWRTAFVAHAGLLLAMPEGEREPADVARALRLHDAQLGAAWTSVMEAELADQAEPPPTSGDPLPWLATTQASLGAHEAVLIYALAEAQSPFPSLPTAGSWVFVLTRERLEAHPLVPRHQLAAQTRAWRAAQRAGDPDREREVAAVMGAALLGELAKTLDPEIRSLIIVPHAELHEVPFAALALADGTIAAERWSLQRAPSVHELVRWRQQPAVTDERPLHVLAAPENLTDTLGDPRPALPWATSEADSIAALFGDRATIMRGPAATESDAKAKAGERSVLHVAAHSSVHSGDPLRSAIHLAADTEDDGEWTVAEVFEQRFDGEVVILSSCDSNTGVVLAGEGVAALGQAFQGRGARAVVATLWPVRDAEAHVFMHDLYTGLAAGQTLDDALGFARREAITSGRPADQWAGYVLLGDGRARLSEAPVSASAADIEPDDPVPTSEREVSWWMLGAGAVLGGIAALIWTRSRRTRRTTPTETKGSG